MAVEVQSSSSESLSVPASEMVAVIPSLEVTVKEEIPGPPDSVTAPVIRPILQKARPVPPTPAPKGSVTAASAAPEDSNFLSGSQAKDRRGPSFATSGSERSERAELDCGFAVAEAKGPLGVSLGDSLHSAGVEKKDSAAPVDPAVPAVDCWWVATDKESLSSFDLLQRQLRSRMPYSSSCDVCVRARGLKPAYRRTEISEHEVQLDQFWHGALKFLVVVRSKSFAIGCVSGDNAIKVIVADLSHWLSHFGLANQSSLFLSDAEGYMRTIWRDLLEKFPVFKGSVEQFAAGRHAPVAERAVRTLRESVSSVLLQMQDSRVGLRNNRRAYTLVFQHACHIHNRYSVVTGSVLSPLQRLRRNQHKPHQAYVFGATILTSGPPAKASEILGRFTYGGRTWGLFLTRAAIGPCAIQLMDGTLEVVQSPSVKLVLPIRYDLE